MSSASERTRPPARRTNDWCTRRVQRAAAIALMLLGAICAGCNGPSPIAFLSPADARQALQRINDNLARIDGTLYCSPATVSFRFRDAGGTDHRFLGHPATVIFDAPRCLYFDIKSSLIGSVARIGSNAEQYWLWIDTPDARKLWHGTWQALEAGRARPIAVPPNQLLDALMMRPLPEQLPEGLPPLMFSDGRYQHLVFNGLDDAAWPYAERELVLDRKPPHMPIEIVDRLSDGRVVMHAYLKGYQPVRGTGPDGPYTARRYVVYWELDQAEMRLDLNDVRYRIKDTPFCDFPEGWDGEVEFLDKPAWPEASGAVLEGPGQK